MNEDILSFIWRFQYFHSAGLETDEKMRLSVIRTGNKNRNAGPDFSEACVLIDGIQWIGNIEIHVRSSDWYKHSHEKNAAYESVVLHVVWENDEPVIRQDGTLLPTLKLNGLVRPSVLERYMRLQQDADPIPCASLFPDVSAIIKTAMLDSVLAERLHKKSEEVYELLAENRQDWEETAYQWIARHFGFKLNDAAFSGLIKKITCKIIRKSNMDILHTEALLFGCAGLLPENSENQYVKELKTEFRFLSAKYNLSDKIMPPHEWKFAKLRPAGFPTVRLAQFAQLFTRKGSLFSQLISAKTYTELQSVFRLEQSAYWREHYIFDKKAASKVPFMGKDAINLLIMNAAVPLLAAYSRQRQKPELMERIVHLLTEMPAENNRITREWNKVGMCVTSAADSQALVEWYNHYCTNRKCLACSVGAALVRGV
ncbi:DUF2851 family protein [Dyadobacter sediminis]|uniref:DUF2851 family protein n=1 Tax=Dyadobacter sediminis TaxID=1493691 RepID=A0A5R9KIE2_9BACT|nr:DUF2851 family protein [Dyadobacter sediminis]TLU95993.1 DUF2851 family protein [Dyadobacter sediminis]GGB78358.1 hypothetical protein GCM10011325_02330 [Dyadobacter sediminis]